MADLLTHGDPPLTSLLPPALVEKLFAAGTERRFGSGALIHGRGDDTAGLSIIRAGAVRFTKTMADGREITMTVLGPGHTFGEVTLFADMGRAYDAVAVGETVVAQLAKRVFERLLDDEPMLARALLVAMTRRLYSALGFLDDMRTLPLPVRTAKLIAGMLASAKAATHVECRQSDLAFTLGVSRVSVGKALASLQAEELIALGYGSIAVPDAARLSDWIEENSR